MFLGRFENFKKFDYLWRKVFRKVFKKKSSTSLSGGISYTNSTEVRILTNWKLTLHIYNQFKFTMSHL